MRYRSGNLDSTLTSFMISRKCFNPKASSGLLARKAITRMKVSLKVSFQHPFQACSERHNWPDLNFCKYFCLWTIFLKWNHNRHHQLQSDTYKLFHTYLVQNRHLKQSINITSGQRKNAQKNFVVCEAWTCNLARCFVGTLRPFVVFKLRLQHCASGARR